MTYKECFVVEVKHNGKIMRVKDGFVNLPFGSEYSLLLKNLNSRKALVNINIDGQDVLDGNSLVIDPNQTTELFGFMRGNTAKNKFKFIKKTQEVIEHRGDKIDDGFIRVEFAYEIEEPIRIRNIINEHHYYHYYSKPYYINKPEPFVWSNTYASTGILNDSRSCDAPEKVSESFDSDALKTPIDNLGITVKGSEINQNFHYASIGETEQSKVIVIQLRGINTSGEKIQSPITVSTKLTCSSCGKKSKSSFKFCPGCGTYLE